MPQEAFTSASSSHVFIRIPKTGNRLLRACRATATTVHKPAFSPRTQLDPNTPLNKMASHQLSNINFRASLFIMCVGTFAIYTDASDVSKSVNNAPQAVHHGNFQNGVVGSSTVTILTENEERKCGKHCKDNEEGDDADVDDERYQDGEDDDVDDDDDDFEEDNGVDFVDQRQNGTENYRIKVSGLLLIIAPPELPMPTPSSTETPPTVPSNDTNASSSWTGVKKQFNVRRHGQTFIDQQKRKLSRYQARIPQFIMALLRNRHATQKQNQ